MQENNVKKIQTIDTLFTGIAFDKEAVWQNLELKLHERNIVVKSKNYWRDFLKAAAVFLIAFSILAVTFYNIQPAVSIAKKILPSTSLPSNSINKPVVYSTQKITKSNAFIQKETVISTAKITNNQVLNIDTLSNPTAMHEVIEPVKPSTDSLTATSTFIIANTNVLVKTNQLKKAKPKLAVVHISDLADAIIESKMVAEKTEKNYVFLKREIEQSTDNTPINTEPKTILFFRVKPTAVSTNTSLQD
jgi:hypothetical protein